MAPSHALCVGQKTRGIATLVLARMIECGDRTNTPGSNGNVGFCSTDFQARMWCESAILRTDTLTALYYVCANKLMMMVRPCSSSHKKYLPGQTERSRG